MSQGHNSGEQEPLGGQDPIDDHLLGTVKQLAAREDEIADIRQDINEKVKQLKADGYEAKLVRELVKEFRGDANEVANRHRLKVLYLQKIGIPI